MYIVQHTNAKMIDYNRSTAALPLSVVLDCGAIGREKWETFQTKTG